MTTTLLLVQLGTFLLQKSKWAIFWLLYQNTSQYTSCLSIWRVLRTSFKIWIFSELYLCINKSRQQFWIPAYKRYKAILSPKLNDNLNYLSTVNSFGSLQFNKTEPVIETKVTSIILKSFKFVLKKTKMAARY